MPDPASLPKVTVTQVNRSLFRLDNLKRSAVNRADPRRDRFYLSELVAPILPIGMASAGISGILLWGVDRLRGIPFVANQAALTLGGCALLVALAWLCRVLATRGYLQATVLTVIAYGGLMTTLLSLSAWRNDEGLLTVFPASMALVVVGSIFAPRMWHLALGFAVTMLPPVILATRIDPSVSNEGRYYPQVLAFTAATALTFFLLIGYLKRLYYETLMASLDRARRDPLTTLLNRAAWSEDAGAVLARRDARSAGAAVLYLDIDHFKRINDLHGHAAGDVALVRIADLLRTSLPPGALPARFGGEEFVVLLDRCDVDGARRTARAVQEAIRHTASAGLEVTLSAGIACHELGEPLDVLVGRADAALLRAKMNGRNRIEAHEARLTDAIRLPTSEPMPHQEPARLTNVRVGPALSR